MDPGPLAVGVAFLAIVIAAMTMSDTDTDTDTDTTIIQAQCSNCGCREALFEVSRAVGDGDALTGPEWDRVMEFTHEPCSSCGQPLGGSRIVSDRVPEA